MMVEKEVDLAKIILASARENFQTMVFMPIEEVVEPGQSISGDALRGTIVFEETLEGCFSFACSKDCAHAMASNMLGMEPSEELSDEEVCDAVGEVTRLIMDSIDSHLHEYVDAPIVSVPPVVSGQTLVNNLGDSSEKVIVYVSIENKYLAELTMTVRNHVTRQAASLISSWN